jgi:ABC-type dipeptide/oligopeptide/nickel transport system permease component
MGTFKHLILPSITYALALVGVLTRLVRTAMLENMKQDYVRTARAKGLAERVVLLKHVLRNSLIPWVTYLGIMIGEALGGSVVIETVFAWPGTGRLLIDSLMNMDYPVVEVMILLITVFIVSVNLIVDMLYGLLDPRVSRN